jgi:hypothetical protein
MQEKYGTTSPFDKEGAMGEFRDYIENMIGRGAPEGVVEEIFAAVEEANTLDEMFNIFADEYTRVAEFYMNIESGGRGGRQPPNMDQIGEKIQENQATILPVFADNINQAIDALNADGTW